MPTCSRRSRRSSSSTATCRATWCSRSCAGCPRLRSPRPDVQLRSEQLEPHLGRSLGPIYVVHGDEPLIALEAADAVRAAARSRGFTDREVFEPGRSFDWSELSHSLASLSLFGGKKIVELRLPSGKPGAQGGEAIAQYCERPSPDILFLVSLPRLDRMSQSSAWFGALSSAGVVVDV